MGEDRVFVVWQTALGYRVMVRHPYGRMERLEPGDGREAFTDPDAVVRAVGREVLGRALPELARDVLRRRLDTGGGPRWALAEEVVRQAAARFAPSEARPGAIAAA